jgi:undecaprenyl-diphosphatase
MPLYQAVILALIQGLTEFLPVSSTAHLALAPWLLGWRDPGLTFDVALHVGTLLAVAAYFARVWIRLVRSAFGRRLASKGETDANPRLFWLLVIATIPAGFAGLALEKYAESTLRSPYVIAAMMISIGVVMWLADRAGRFQKTLPEVSLADALAIGLAQALAIVPGTSRSGVTIAAGLFRHLDRETAARFSFLLSTPVIAGAALKAAMNVRHAGGIPPDMRAAFLAGVAVSAVTGFAAIAFLIRYLQRHTLNIFVCYRIVCGIIILALAMFFRDPVMRL